MRNWISNSQSVFYSVLWHDQHRFVDIPRVAISSRLYSRGVPILLREERKEKRSREIK